MGIHPFETHLWQNSAGRGQPWDDSDAAIHCNGARRNSSRHNSLMDWVHVCTCWCFHFCGCSSQSCEVGVAFQLPFLQEKEKEKRRGGKFLPAVVDETEKGKPRAQMWEVKVAQVGMANPPREGFSQWSRLVLLQQDQAPLPRARRWLVWAGGGGANLSAFCIL